VTTSIPFNVPALEGRELELVAEAMRSGHTSSSGRFSQQAREILLAQSGSCEVLLTTSCTAALELSAMLLNLRPGDTVVVPSFTFVTTALAFVRQGAKVLFCDVEPETLALDPVHLAELMDDSVRAVVLVHYAGVAGDVPGVLEVMAGYPRATLVEDAAHGLFGTWEGRPLGTLGRFATYSFHETKNIVCGEGGALVLNDPDDVARARVLFDKGTNRRAFMEGQVDKYSWVDTGSSFGLADTLAAHLLGQLEQREVIQAKRRTVHERYVELLAGRVEQLGVRLPVVPAASGPAHHLFHLLLPDHATRNRVMQEMRERGVHATFHYVPLHDSPGGRRFAARATDCPVSANVAGRLLRLPFFNGLTDAQAEQVVQALLAGLEAPGHRA
jgi:dTDP-4-amino-4,6-dideoxygalactose transaminase